MEQPTVQAENVQPSIGTRSSIFGRIKYFSTSTKNADKKTKPPVPEKKTNLRKEVPQMAPDREPEKEVHCIIVENNESISKQNDVDDAENDQLTSGNVEPIREDTTEHIPPSQTESNNPPVANEPEKDKVESSLHPEVIPGEGLCEGNVSTPSENSVHENGHQKPEQSSSENVMENPNNEAETRAPRSSFDVKGSTKANLIFLENLPANIEKPSVNAPMAPTIQSTALESNLKDHRKKATTTTNIQTPSPQEKRPISGGMPNRMKYLSSSKSSQSSLSSSGPSSSSLCHLTELSQPKPEVLRSTLMNLRQLHGRNAEHLGSIERHLRGLRSRPTRTSRAKTTEPNPTPMDRAKRYPEQSADDDQSTGDREAFDRFAAHLFAQLEQHRAQESCEASNVMMPIEVGYYRATYDALVQTFGQPYHKCTLELYQQLAAELGLQAEMFVMEKTPASSKTSVREPDDIDNKYVEHHVLSAENTL